jgi:hypothetical protein
MKGYKTLQLREELHNKLVEAYEKRKQKLIMENIKSFTAFGQVLLERAIDAELLATRFEIVRMFEGTVVVRDYFRGKDAEVVIKNGKVFCELDDSGSCDHVGFVLHDPLVVKIAQEKGVKLRKA